jgi:hypothetical protein
MVLSSPYWSLAMDIAREVRAGRFCVQDQRYNRITSAGNSHEMREGAHELRQGARPIPRVPTPLSVVRGLDPRIHHLRKILSKGMDCRVEPGNDAWSGPCA